MKIRKAFLVTFSIFFFIIFYFGIHEYEGQLFYFIFCSLSSFFCLIYLTDRDSFYFENFLSSFLFLGIWFNFTIKISFFNSTFPEGVGQFDYSPSSYDEVMLVSSITYLSLIFSSYLRRIFLTYKNTEHIDDISHLKNKYLLISIFLLLILTILLSYINYNYSIYQRGTTQKIEIGFILMNFFKWFFMIGFASLFVLVINLLIKKNNKLPRFSIIIQLFSEFFANISMLSRGMIFSSISIFWGIFRNKDFKNNFAFIIIYLVLIIFFFILSIKVTDTLRDKNLKKYNVSSEKKISIFCDESGSTVRSSVVNANIENKYVKILVSRLIGVEGIMAVQAVEQKNYKLLIEALKETTSKKEGLTFFDNLKDDLRCNHAYYKSITLPGIVAFLYYSGSLTFIFLSLAIISILFCILEFYLVIISYRNFIFVSLIGQILAYRLWHFGFAPLNSIKLLVAIFLTTIIIYLANKLITKL